MTRFWMTILAVFVGTAVIFGLARATDGKVLRKSNMPEVTMDACCSVEGPQH